MNRAETAKILGYLTCTYPGMKLQEGSVEAWQDALSDIPFEVAQAAARRCAQSQHFPPSIAEIRAAAVDVTGQSAPTFDQVWLEVREQIAAVGYNRRPTLSPVASLLVRGLGGWYSVCNGQDGIIDAQARKLYETLGARLDREVQAPALDPRVTERLAGLSSQFALPQ